MAVLSENSDIEEDLTIVDSFYATAVLCSKENNIWIDEEVIIKSKKDIKNIFRERLNIADAEVIQVNLSKYDKVYFSTDSLGEFGVDAKVRDDGNTTHYMFSPLLLVKCNDEVPVEITPDDVETIKEYIDFV